MVRSIPPITSTGSQRRKVRRISTMPIGGTISIGRPTTSRNIRREEPWDISRHEYKRPKKVQTFPVYEPRIGLTSNIIEDYNGDGDLGVLLQFSGISFLRDAFSKSKRDYGQNSCVYYTSVRFREKEALLMLSTLDDILEFEVVPQRKGINQLFREEAYIPKLAETYDPLSMEVKQRNGIVTISYKQI